MRGVLWHMTVSFPPQTLPPSQWLSAPEFPPCLGWYYVSTLTVDLEASERHQYEEVAAESKACLPQRGIFLGEDGLGTSGVWDKSGHCWGRHPRLTSRGKRMVQHPEWVSWI